LRAVLRRFWPLLRPLAGRAGIVLAASLVAPALEVASVWLFKIVVDRVLVPRDVHALGAVALAYLALAVAGGAVGFVSGYLSAAISERFLLALRTELFAHMQRLSLDFLDRRRLGDLLSRLTSDISAIESFLLSGAIDAAVDAVRVVFFAGALLLLDWRLALLAFVVAPAFWVAARRLSGRLRVLSREKRRRSGALSAVAEESLSNAALVRAYGAEDAELRRFGREGEAGLTASLASARLRALFSPLVDLLEMGGSLVVLAAGTWELARGRLTLGALLVFVTYLGKLYRPVRGLSSFYNGAFSAAASAERVMELLDQPPELPARSYAPLRLSRGVLEFDRVTFRYPGSTAPVLEDLSFRVGPGESLALVGASGAGKSTIVKLLLRFHDPACGRILLDGRDLCEIDPRELRAALAVVLQETLVVHGTVRENIAYGCPAATEETVRRAAEDADVAEFVNALPGNYDCLVGQRGRLLSGGQRQRIAIARAMIRRAPVLVLDEPTAGLDAEAARRVILPLLRLIAGRTTLLVTHDLRLARLASRILVLEKGRVEDAGTHDELLRRGGRYAWSYNLQTADTPIERSA
jgi:ABC-type multidrug transport system fused ATPase/permease subunit